MRVVLDTNVLVSGLLQAHGNPAFVLRLILQRDVEIALDERIMAEYREVLARPKFAFASQVQSGIVRELAHIGIFAGLPQPATKLPDPADQVFLEVALAASADAIVTGNSRHFPPEQCVPVRIVSPAGFMEVWAELNS